MYLFFDRETTGLPRSRHLSAEDVSGWPRIVQLAWAVYDQDGNPMDKSAHIVRPEGFIIPPEATRIHGISDARAREVGEDLAFVLGRFKVALEKAGIILVAHNLEFDRGIVGAEFIRNRISGPIGDLPGICTMMTTTDICRLPGPRYGYKWPKLEELHAFLFGDSYEGPHDAANDVEACARCFFELVQKRYLTFPTL